MTETALGRVATCNMVSQSPLESLDCLWRPVVRLPVPITWVGRQALHVWPWGWLAITSLIQAALYTASRIRLIRQMKYVWAISYYSELSQVTKSFKKTIKRCCVVFATRTDPIQKQSSNRTRCCNAMPKLCLRSCRDWISIFVAQSTHTHTNKYKHTRIHTSICVALCWSFAPALWSRKFFLGGTLEKMILVIRTKVKQKKKNETLKQKKNKKNPEYWKTEETSPTHTSIWFKTRSHPNYKSPCA